MGLFQSCIGGLKKAGKFCYEKLSNACTAVLKKIKEKIKEKRLLEDLVPPVAALGIAGTVGSEFCAEVIASNLCFLGLGLADGGFTFGLSLLAAGMSGALAAIQETVFAIDGNIFGDVGKALDKLVFCNVKLNMSKTKLCCITVGGGVIVACIAVDTFTTQNTLYEENEDMSKKAATQVAILAFLSDAMVRSFARCSGAFGGAKIAFEDAVAVPDLVKGLQKCLQKNPQTTSDIGKYQRWLPRIARGVLIFKFPLLATIEWLALRADGRSLPIATTFAIISMLTDAATFYFITGNNSDKPDDLSAFEYLGRSIDTRKEPKTERNLTPRQKTTLKIFWGIGISALIIDALVLYLTEFFQTKDFLGSLNDPTQSYQFEWFAEHQLSITITEVGFYFAAEFAENIAALWRIMQLFDRWLEKRNAPSLEGEAGETVSLMPAEDAASSSSKYGAIDPNRAATVGRSPRYPGYPSPGRPPPSWTIPLPPPDVETGAANSSDDDQQRLLPPAVSSTPRG